MAQKVMVARHSTQTVIKKNQQMAGVKGKSGGPRRNSGGHRPGAGRQRKQVQPTQTDERDPVKFLLDVMQGIVEANNTQLRAAIAAAQYTNVKKADGGKKDEQAEKARVVGGGKFAASSPPKLVVNNRK